MIAKFTVLTAVLVVAGANPVWIGNPYDPQVYLRNLQPPSIAYGFGSGFSSNIGGITQSSGYGTSFQSGGGQAYGSGFGADGANARGIGYARVPTQQYYQPYASYAIPRNINTAAAQNAGNFGSAISSTQNQDGTAFSAVHNDGGFQSAVSTVQNLGRGFRGLENQGFTLSRADNAGGFQTAISSSQGLNGQSTSIAQNIGGLRTSIANVQQSGLQNSIASAVNAPGFQTAQTHSINNGYY